MWGTTISIANVQHVRGYGTHLVQGFLCGHVIGRGQKQYISGVLEERKYRDEDQYGDEERADRVSHKPAKLLNKQRGYDNAYTAHGVGKHVKKHPLHVCIVGVASM